jgi:hypothetical protein
VPARAKPMKAQAMACSPRKKMAMKRMGT